MHKIKLFEVIQHNCVLIGLFGANFNYMRFFRMAYVGEVHLTLLVHLLSGCSKLDNRLIEDAKLVSFFDWRVEFDRHIVFIRVGCLRSKALASCSSGII